jgi:DNA-binding FrmR family transcriptional regulator
MIGRMELDAEQMQAVVKRLKRAQGQIGGIIKMIEDGRDCQDIVTQMAAVSKALDRAGFATISLGLRQCMSDPEHNQMDVAAMEKLFLSLA